MLRLPAKSGEHHSDEEWEAMRDLFVVLYKIQGKPLPEVRSILAESYGFHATLRQYKSRIIKWGVFKKRSKLLQHAQQQPEIQREGVWGQVQPRRTGQESPITVPVRQQATPPLSRSPSPPGHLGAIHAATYGISSFYSGTLGADVNRFQVRNQTANFNIRKFFDTANSVSALAMSSRWKEAQHLYGEILDQVGSVLEERNPLIIVCLLQICARFYQEGQDAILQRFLGFMVAMASVRGLKSHPLRLLASAWAQPGDHSLNLITMCSQQAIDTMNKQLGPSHAQTLSAWRALHSAQFASGNFAGALDSLASALEIEKRNSVFADYSTLDAQYRIIRCQLAMDNLQAAAANIEELENRLHDFAERKVVGEQLLRKMEQNMPSVKGELLRRRLDPKAEAVLAEIVDQIKSSPVDDRKWMLVHAENQLDCARESLKKGRAEPFKLAC